MDLENIEVFLEIARTRSISGAAKNLFISQSAVSYRLKMLEDELDCKLIERGERTEPEQAYKRRRGISSIGGTTERCAV